MAHRESIQNERLRDYIDSKFFYTVSQSVGYGCPNRSEDVRLVQYLINKFHQKKVLVTDGKYGGLTWNAIKKFQELHDIPKGAGTVSSANGIRWTSPKTGQPYTICILNQYLKTYFDDIWSDPRKDPWFPKELWSHLWGPLPQIA